MIPSKQMDFGKSEDSWTLKSWEIWDGEFVAVLKMHN